MGKSPKLNTDTAPIPADGGSMVASETSAAAIAAAQGVATATDLERAQAAAAAADLAGRPDAAARAVEDIEGSALHAPGIGSGPAAEPLADALRDPVGVAVRLPEGDIVQGGVSAVVGEAHGLPPTLMSREGAFGPPRGIRGVADPELLRQDLAARRNIFRDLASVSLTGAKLAVPMPSSDEVLEEYRAEGFDLVVFARQDGFRRAGVAHPAHPTLRRSRDFEAHEIEALAHDPMLIVQALR